MPSSVFDLVRVEPQEWNRIVQDASGRLFVQADHHRIDFGKRRVRFTSLVDPNATHYLSYQLTAIRTGDRVLLTLSQDAPPVAPQVHANSVTYPRSLGIKEIYVALDEGVEQIFLLEQPLALDGDLIIKGAFETDLPAVLPSGRGDVLFLTGDSTAPSSWDQGIVYERVVVYDSGGRQMIAKTTAQHRRLIITISGDWLSEATYPVVIDPLISIRDFNAQADHAVAYNPSGQEYFVAWQDDRNYASAGWDIYAQRLSLEGFPEGDPIPLFTATGHQEDVAIAYNSNLDEYLLVWTDAGGKDDDIYVQRLSSGGTPIGSEILITGARRNQDRAVIAYNSIDDEYLVAWDDNRASKSPRGYDVFGIRLAGTGEPIGDEIPLCTERGWQIGAAVAHDSVDNEYLVAWADERSGRWDIYGQRVAPDGSFPSSEFVISDAPNDQVPPEIAYNSADNQYLVVWRDNRSDPDLYGVYGRRVLGGNGPIGDEIAISVSQSPVVYLVYPSVSYNGVDNEYFVVWDLSSGNGFDRDVYGRRVSSGGTVQGDEFLVADAVNDQMGPVAPHNGNDEYLVVWTDERNYYVTSFDIYGQRVANDGTLEGFNFPISVTAAGQRYPGLAYNSATNEYLVAWHDQDSPLTGKDIYAQLVFSSSELKGDYFAVSTAAGDQEHATVAHGTVADEYLVPWSDGRNVGTSDWDIYGQRIASGGVLTGTEIIVSNEIGAQQFPAVAYEGDLDEYLVVWQDSRATETDIYGQRITGAGVLTGTEIPISVALGDQAQPVVAHNSAQGEYLVVWEDERAGAGNLDIYGQRVSSSGSLVGSEILISSAVNDQASPAVAYNSATSEYLVVWHDFRDPTSDADIYGQRMSAAGSLVGSEIAISTEVEKQLYPDVDYEAGNDRYLFIWQDGRNGASLTYDIYGQLVTGNGSLENGNFPLSQRTNDEEEPALAYNGTDGNFLLAWELWLKDIPASNIFVDLYEPPPVPKDSFTLIEEDLAAGLITIDEAAEYRVYSLVASPLLPSKYQSDVPIPGEGTALFLKAVEDWESLSPETQQRINDFIAREASSCPITRFANLCTSLAEPYETPEGHFRICYSINENDPCRVMDQTDNNENLIPDYVEELGVGLETAWDVIVTQMGYAPPSWGDPDGRYPVDIVRAIPDRPGMTWPEPIGMVIDNDESIDDLRVLAGHEFFHVSQWEYITFDGYNWLVNDETKWWMEASAQWGQHEVYPGDDTYDNDLDEYLSAPWLALPRVAGVLDPGGSAYGSFIFATYLEEKIGPQSIVRETWERYQTAKDGEGPVIPAIDEVLQSHGTSLPSEFPVFMRDNYFMDYEAGDDFRAELEIYEGRPERIKEDNLSETTPAEGPVTDKAPSFEIEHLGTMYVDFSLAEGASGGMLRVTVDVTTTGTTAQPQVTLFAVRNHETRDYYPMPVSLRDLGGGNYRAVVGVAGFGSPYNLVTLAINNAALSSSGDGMEYHYRAEVVPTISETSPAYRADAALDDENNIHVTWTESGGTVLHRRWADGSWEPTTQIYAEDWSYRPSVATDVQGTPHVVWGNLDSDAVYYSQWDGLNWTTPFTVTTYHFISPDIAAGYVTDTLHLHVVWAGKISEASKPVYFREWIEGSGWQDAEIISDGAGDDRAHSVTVSTDSQGDPHVGWHTNSGEVFHRERSDGTWAAVEKVDLDSTISTAPHMAIDAQDNVHIVWNEPQYFGNIFYRVRDASGWSVVEQINESSVGSRHAAVDVDSAGAVHVAWYEGDHLSPPPVYLYYSYNDGTGWSSPIALSLAGEYATGDGIRVVVEHDDTLHIIYQPGEYYEEDVSVYDLQL